MRSNRSQTQDRTVSMTEGLLAPLAVDPDEQLQAHELSTRHKKSASAPGVFIPNSLSQLEDAVRFCLWQKHHLPHTIPSSGCVACKCGVAEYS